jgi:hypothetical protein
MIKMIVPVWRKPGMSFAEFTDRWGVGHAKLAREHSAAMGMRRYIQNHKIESPDLEAFAKARGWAAPPDGLTEGWWDSMEAMAASFTSQEGIRAGAILEEDERRFVDHTRVSAFLAKEVIVFEP